MPDIGFRLKMWQGQLGEGGVVQLGGAKTDFFLFVDYVVWRVSAVPRGLLQCNNTHRRVTQQMAKPEESLRS